MALTDEQRNFADHVPGAFVQACPGAGKTQAIVARIACVAPKLPARKGVAVLSFTNSAIEVFIGKCHASGLNRLLCHPGFVGTFDSFLRQFFFSPGGIDGVNTRPTVVDSWQTLGVDVRLRGRSAFRGSGVPLDFFSADTNQIDPASIGHAGLRVHVQNNQNSYQRAAEQRRRALRQQGYVSAADVRIDVLRSLQDPDRSGALGRALGARFQELIVDEAQDCNPLDCEIIQWLRAKGISVSVVADTDQSIYGFRHGNPANLLAIAATYNAGDRLTLSGNFRSSPSICGLAATLRVRSIPDTPLGEEAANTGPVHIFAYRGSSVSSAIGRHFCDLLQALGMNTNNSIILAHARKNALRACGLGSDEEAGESNTAKIARAVSTFWSSIASSRERESSMRVVERAILDLMGQIDDGEVPSRAAERRGIEPRWLRRSALELVSRVPRTCTDSNQDRTRWISALRQEVLRLRLPYRAGTSEATYFRDLADATWHRLLVAGEVPEIGCSTIHEAKGKEYEAVCIVIPPDIREPRRTEQLFNVWEGRRDDEAKRVIYVGITRAKRLGVLAIPAQFSDRLTTMLTGNQVNFRVHNL